MNTQTSPSADKVLVVDDDFRTRVIARAALEAAGFEVTEAASGEEALAQLASYTPDLILLDVMMPVMDGFQTCRELRRHPVGFDIPVLMMTGLDDPETIACAYRAGAIDFTLKPVQWLILPHRISFIIRSSRTTRALKESESRFRSIMDLTPAIAVQGYNLNGITTYWNKSSELLYGYTEEEALGKSLLELIIPPAMRQDVRNAMTWMAESGQPIPPGELQLMRKDGSLVPVFSGHALLCPPGREPELFCMDVDLTQLKHTENELRKAKETAEAASLAKSNFLATMSHEIRTPLSALMGNIKLLAGTPLGSQQQEYLNDSMAASRILLQVINDVLDYSKIEAGKIDLQNEPFSIAALGRQMVRIFAPGARQKGLSLSLVLHDGLPDYISGDHLRISQIIANLLSNAIKFTRQGSVTLEMSCDQGLESKLAEPYELVITVRDTGIGISEDQQDKIFENFSQLENFGTRQYSGTGLGLSICRRLTQLMGGSITLSSQPGQGSVFQVSLPAVVCEAPQQMEHEQDSPVTPRTILLADDDALGRSVMTSLLECKGHRVTAVENGLQLLDLLPGNTFDIVLTDISMPDIDGIEVTKIIRSGKRPGVDPMIPIIAMTAHAFSRDRELFLAAGVDGFAAKPVDLEMLLQQIEQICSSKQNLPPSG